ncbi:MAG TPA: glycosyltransferase family protein [Polyangiaceae bacterium LLY-WYZ-15_(1-7)]|nr:teichoic acid biosynthesis protein [Sandaracinus sp.]HJL06095.1 glycosyltransferase family protein [Polyangiaceae bacterium LLY-WYZ-15_(1-7)]MBJ71224.1 teichoic acid biosynthesis protein [Sandaracinus sp.]HJL06979.1 glycosyltransferase family protein [Polyangiaceae bacterium LLY-WYZ-15_(1-7)]HJL39149.1 glycosyltransferase family protein [Polyangiaceae bacterium LLY-WYZ-15_(1-7)]
MATIFFGVQGEGRGHAARALALVEALRPHHRLVLYANGQAFEMLEPLYVGSDVELYRLPDVAFRYGPGRRLSYVRTGLGNAHYLWRLRQLVRMVELHMEREQPDLVLTDFEPVTARAARAAGVPFLSVDHQHFLLTHDLSDLPAHLRRYAAFMAPFVHAWYQGQTETVVSSFFSAPIKPRWRRCVPIGVLLRREVREASVEDRDHLVAYVRRSAPRSVLEALAASRREVRVYGLGERPSVGRLRFRAIDPHRFVEDLATCEALVTTAGNQLVGESLYLGKPVLAMPEMGNYEQQINATFLRRSGAGAAHDMERLGGLDVERFLDRGPRYREHIERRRLDGLPRALERIEAHLQTPSRVLPFAPPAAPAPAPLREAV